MRYISALFIFLFLTACELVSSLSGRGPEKCSIDKIDGRFKKYEYSNPKSFKQINDLYQAEMKPYEDDRIRKKWEDFQDTYSKGDCLYTFTSDRESWFSLAGVKGYVIFRGAELVSVFITKKS